MDTDGLYQDALEVLILTAIVAKEARQDVERHLKESGSEITALQYRVLRQLQQGQSTITALSVGLMVEPATLVPVIDILERHGLVRRGHDPRDRRRTPLELTETGSERLDHIPFVHHDDIIATYLCQLTSQERSVFLQRLRDLVITMHGHDNAVRHIHESVNRHFAFGEQQERTRRQQEGRRGQRGDQHPGRRSSKTSSTKTSSTPSTSSMSSTSSSSSKEDPS